MKGLQRHPGGLREFLGGSFGVELGLPGQRGRRQSIHQGQGDCAARGCL